MPQDKPPTMTNPIDIAKECWFLTGATASGKSKTSLELAKRINAEVVSLDSMAIYRGMDIGTAKPSADDQNVIPHHLIDIRSPTETFSTSQYRNAAIKVATEIRGRGKQVLFVGGTALYLKALLRGMFEGPPANWEFRKQVENEVKQHGGKFLHERLEMVDPVAASNIHPNDHRRIIRALEVFTTTGKPISHWQMEFDNPTPTNQCRVFAIRHQREILHERIEQRVGSMFEEGLIDEVRNLLDKHTMLSHTAAQAVGYREVIEHLEGKYTEDETQELVLVRTRRFARHQETWFRNLSECRWVDLTESFDHAETASNIESLAEETFRGQD